MSGTTAAPAAAGWVVPTARPRRRRSAWRRRATPYLFVAPAVVYLLGITLYPGLYAIYQSFFHVRFNAWTFAGLANYKKLLTDPEFWQALTNTAIIGAIALTLECVIALALAAFAYRDPWVRSWRIVFLMPMLFMPSAVAFIWKLAFNDGRVVNDLLGRLGLIQAPLDFLGSVWLARLSLIVVDVWQWTPFLFIIFVAALQGQDAEIEEAARLDGARWQPDLLERVAAADDAGAGRGAGATRHRHRHHVRLGVHHHRRHARRHHGDDQLFHLPDRLQDLQFRLRVRRFGGHAGADDGGRAAVRQALLPVAQGLTMGSALETKADPGLAAATAAPPAAATVPVRRRKRSGESLVLRYAILGSWALFCLAPILWFLSIGLRPRTEIIAPEPIYIPTLSADAWHMIWTAWPMANYLFNSLAAIAGSVVIDLLLAVPAAYSLARYEYRMREDLGFYILSTRMMAPAIVAIPIFFLFRALGLLDTVWALMLIYAAMNLSLVTWIIRSYMLDIPHEIEDAARTDGASDLRILLSIVVPMCMPGIVTASVIAAIFAINEFLFTLLIASTKNAYTLSVALANFTGGSDGIIYNAIALVSFIAFAPVLVLVIAIQRHLSRGLTMGAVKG